MSKLQKENVLSNKKSDNYSLVSHNQYLIDSFKLSVDASIFDKVNIPEEYTLIDSNTGEEIDNFKRKSLPLRFNDTKIYLGQFKKVLKQGIITKVYILFSSKINNPEDYFKGITEKNVKDILSFLRDSKRLIFKDIERVYKELRCRDLDIKVDRVLKNYNSDDFLSYCKTLEKDKFIYDPVRCKTYDNKKEGISIQANFRDNSSYTKPFTKLYDKYKELLAEKNSELWEDLPGTLRLLLKNNLVVRYEFTLKNNDYFKKLKISDKISDILQLNQNKLQEIGQILYDNNFKKKTNMKPINIKELTNNERVLYRCIWELKDSGYNYSRIRDIVTIDSLDFTNKNKHRREKLFNKIWAALVDDSEESKAYKKKIKTFKDFQRELGFES